MRHRAFHPRRASRGSPSDIGRNQSFLIHPFRGRHRHAWRQPSRLRRSQSSSAGRAAGRTQDRLVERGQRASCSRSCSMCRRSGCTIRSTDRRSTLECHWIQPAALPNPSEREDGHSCGVRRNAAVAAVARRARGEQQHSASDRQRTCRCSRPRSVSRSGASSPTIEPRCGREASPAVLQRSSEIAVATRLMELSQVKLVEVGQPLGRLRPRDLDSAAGVVAGRTQRSVVQHTGRILRRCADGDGAGPGRTRRLLADRRALGGGVDEARADQREAPSGEHGRERGHGPRGIPLRSHGHADASRSWFFTITIPWVFPIWTNGEVPQSSYGGYIYASSSVAKETWPAVIEKAFAVWRSGGNADFPDSADYGAFERRRLRVGVSRAHGRGRVVPLGGCGRYVVHDRGELHEWTCQHAARRLDVGKQRRLAKQSGLRGREPGREPLLQHSRDAQREQAPVHHPAESVGLPRREPERLHRAVVVLGVLGKRDAEPAS